LDSAKLKTLLNRQIEAARYLDTVVDELFDMIPKNTSITTTADHGQQFGEDGYFGHRPIQHEKAFEVPFV
jgi:glucan phosphoethanolaminetransferase (alkaline phosphatase superfamily)